MYKRGLSNVIITLIIILLGLVIVSIIWFVVRNLVSEGSESISLGGFLVDLQIEQAYKSGNNLVVGVERSRGEGDLRKIKFIVSNDSVSKSIEKDANIGELEKNTYSISQEELNISINSADEVSIAPVYESNSGEETLGDVTDTTIISDTAPTNGGTDGGTNGDTTNGGTDGETNGDDGTTCTPDTDPCGTKTCGEVGDGCGGTVTCGTCSAGSFCNSNQQCEEDSVINSGVIYSVWPSEAPKYFDSEDFPKNDQDMIDMINKYVNFTSESCKKINYGEYLPENDRSYVRLEAASNINANDNYQVWHTSSCGG